MEASFTELIQGYIKRRNLSVEQLATLANLSRKTLYRWVNGEVSQPRHWYQIVALGKALRLNQDEVDQLLLATKNPCFAELKDLARYEYELDLLEEFSQIEPLSSMVPRPQVRVEPWAALEAPAGAVRPESPFYVERTADSLPRDKQQESPAAQPHNSIHCSQDRRPGDSRDQVDRNVSTRSSAIREAEEYQHE